MSAETKWTPGEWKVVPHITEGLSCASISAFEDDIDREIGGRSIATVWGDHDGANGNLIASAPALYEALQNIINGISTGDVHIETAQDETWANAMRKSHAALRQARRETE